MKIPILLLAMLAVGWAAENPVEQLARQDISNADRDSLVESLKRAEVVSTAAPILELLRDYASPTEPGIGNKPWMSDHHSHRAKVLYAAGAIWDGLFAGKSDPAKAAILLHLLNAHDDARSRYFVIQRFKTHWTSEVEEKLATLAQNEETPDDTKLQALSVLIERAGERYVPLVNGFIQSAPAMEKSQRFTSLFNVGDRFYQYSPHHQGEIVALGFELLKAEAEPGSTKGYFLARQLGYFLKVTGGFAPDQHATQYQGTSGLTDAFFAQTVQNALEWRRANTDDAATKP